MGKIGVLVALESDADATKLEQFGKQLAMHIAASNPQYMTLDAVPADAKAKELDVSKTKAEKLFAEFTAFEASMQKYKDKFTGKERNFSEKTFEPKLKEFNQRAANLDSLIEDVKTKSVSEDRQDKQDAEKTQKLLNVFFEEVAFMIKKERWREGLASEAAQGIIKHAHEVLGLRRLICLVVPGNEASAGVAKKVGMSFERSFTDEFGRSHIYSRALLQ